MGPDHADHRMLALAFDKVMGRILGRQDNAIFPLCIRDLAITCLSCSKEDFYNLNLLSTQRPKAETTRLYFGKMT